MNKIDLLNSIEVIDDSACCGKLEYVHVANTPMNRKKLRQVGATDQEIKEATDAFDESIDIACIRFTYIDAKWYEKRLGGFLNYVPDHAPEWAKRLTNQTIC